MTHPAVLAQEKWIRRRILPRTIPVVSLDTSEVSCVENEAGVVRICLIQVALWDSAVFQPARCLCEQFLQSVEGFKEALEKVSCDCCFMHLATSLFDKVPAARLCNVSEKQQTRFDQKKYICQVCGGRTFMGSDQFEEHIASRQHKQKARNCAKTQPR